MSPGREGIVSSGATSQMGDPAGTRLLTSNTLQSSAPEIAVWPITRARAPDMSPMSPLRASLISS